MAANGKGALPVYDDTPPQRAPLVKHASQPVACNDNQYTESGDRQVASHGQESSAERRTCRERHNCQKQQQNRTAKPAGNETCDRDDEALCSYA